jgi:hypothetical protein
MSMPSYAPSLVPRRHESFLGFGSSSTGHPEVTLGIALASGIGNAWRCLKMLVEAWMKLNG